MNSDNTILVVDDEPLVLSGTSRLLKQVGYNVIEAQTGEQALKSARKNIPDLILLDIVLPDMDGLEICRILKTDDYTSGIFICIISGEKTTSSDQSEGLEIGADDYIVRPIENRELLARVQAMIRLRNTEKELEKHRSHLEDLVEERTAELCLEISERIIAENALHESEEKLRLFVEYAPAALAMFDLEMRYVAFSRRWMTDYRLGDQNIIGRSHYDVFPEIPDRWKTAHRRGLAGEIVQAEEDNLIRLNGTIQFLQWEIRPWHKADGSIGGIVIFTEDITERKQTETALMESEIRFRTIAEQSPNMIFINKSGRVVYANDLCKEMMGYDKDEFLSPAFNFLSLIAPESLKQAELSFKKHIENLEVPAVEYTLIKKDGSHIATVIHTKLIEYEGGSAILGIVTDITEHKMNEKALATAKKQWEETFDAISDWVSIIDKNNNIIRSNKASKSLVDLSPKHVIGKRCYEIVHGMDCPISDCPLERAVKSKQRESAEIQLANGRWIMISVDPFKNENNDELFVHIVRDITERKWADEALRKSEKKLQVVFMHAPAGLILMDGQSVVLECNQYLANMFGTKREKYLGAKLLDHITEEPVRQSLVDAISDDAVHHYEGPYTSIFSGKKLFINLSCVKIAPDLIIAIIMDITECNRTEELLKESEARYRQLFENAPAGIYEVDLTTGRMLSVNDSLCEYTGYTKDELLNMNALDLLTEESQKIFIERMAGFAAGKPVTANLEFKCRCKSGREFWMSINPKYFYKEGIPVRASVVAHDITERKRLEAEKAQLETQNRQLQKAESLSRMAGAIAHNFNNQLQVVLGNLEMAMNDKPSDSECLAEAMNAARKAADVSGLMLTYLGQKSGNQEPIDLSEVCRRRYTLLQSVAPKDMILKADFPPAGPVIRANADQILHVLTNLVTNAWESTEENQRGIVLTVKTVSKADIPAFKRFPADWKPQESVYACLELVDAGCGISCEDIEKIFDPFYSTKFTGRGMGLSVVLGIVKSHNGGITVESEPGGGSIFRVFFPLSAEEILLQPDKQIQSPEIQGGGTVLLIEDEEQVRKMANKMLTHLGYTVIEAKDGSEAVQIFQQHQDEIRCVLSDLTMPGMNGWDTLASLRKLSPGIPVILSSGYDEARVMADEHSERPNAFLGKPYQLKGLKEKISRVLTRIK